MNNNCINIHKLGDNTTNCKISFREFTPAVVWRGKLSFHLPEADIVH